MASHATTSPSDGSNFSRRRFLAHAGAAGAVGGVASLAALGPASTAQAAESKELWLDVKDFGAVGDGETDDVEAIQAAIDAAHEAGGGTVFMPPGIYLIDESQPIRALLLREKTWLLGAGRNATTVRLADGANAHVISFEHNKNDMAISDLTIDGNRENQTVSCHGLRLHGNARTYIGRVIIKEVRHYGIGVGYDTGAQIPWRDSTVEDVEIFNIGYDTVGDGFDAKRTERCTIRRVSVHNCVANGCDIRGNHTSCSDIYVGDVGGVGFSQRMSAYDPPSEEIDLRESRHLYGSNITVERCGSMGFWMEAVEGGAEWFTNEWFGRCFLVNAIARECGARGYYIAGGDGRLFAHLTNCLAEGNGQHGFQINGKNLSDVRAKLVNCTAKGNGLCGFWDAAANSEGDALVACEAVDNSQFGFYIGGACHSLLGCRADDNVDLGYRIEGADCSIIGGSIFSDSTEGIRVVAGAERNLIQGVSIKTTTGRGVNIQSGALDTKLVDNNLAGVGGTKVLDDGTSTVQRNEPVSALTAADSTGITEAATSTVDEVYGAEEAAVLKNAVTRVAELETVVENLRTRNAELESRLQSQGLIS